MFNHFDFFPAIFQFMVCLYLSSNILWRGRIILSDCYDFDSAQQGQASCYKWIFSIFLYAKDHRVTLVCVVPASLSEISTIEICFVVLNNILGRICTCHQTESGNIFDIILYAVQLQKWGILFYFRVTLFFSFLNILL